MLCVIITDLRFVYQVKSVAEWVVVFCASTIGGLYRSLTPGEILNQVIFAQKDVGERISNIVMMGIGEPLDNFDNVIKFLHNVNHEKDLT